MTIPKKTPEDTISLDEARERFHEYYDSRSATKIGRLRAKVGDIRYRKTKKKTLVPDTPGSARYLLPEGPRSYDMMGVDSFSDDEIEVDEDGNQYVNYEDPEYGTVRVKLMDKPRKKDGTSYHKYFKKVYKKRREEGDLSDCGEEEGEPCHLVDVYWKGHEAARKNDLHIPRPRKIVMKFKDHLGNVRKSDFRMGRNLLLLTVGDETYYVDGSKQLYDQYLDQIPMTADIKKELVDQGYMDERGRWSTELNGWEVYYRHKYNPKRHYRLSMGNMTVFDEVRLKSLGDWNQFLKNHKGSSRTVGLKPTDMIPYRIVRPLGEAPELLKESGHLTSDDYEEVAVEKEEIGAEERIKHLGFTRKRVAGDDYYIHGETNVAVLIENLDEDIGDKVDDHLMVLERLTEEGYHKYISGQYDRKTKKIIPITTEEEEESSEAEVEEEAESESDVEVEEEKVEESEEESLGEESEEEEESSEVEEESLEELDLDKEEEKEPSKSVEEMKEESLDIEAELESSAEKKSEEKKEELEEEESEEESESSEYDSEEEFEEEEEEQEEEQEEIVPIKTSAEEESEDEDDDFKPIWTAKEKEEYIRKIQKAEKYKMESQQKSKKTKEPVIKEDIGDIYGEEVEEESEGEIEKSPEESDVDEVEAAEVSSSEDEEVVEKEELEIAQPESDSEVEAEEESEVEEESETEVEAAEEKESEVEEESESEPDIEVEAEEESEVEEEEEKVEESKEEEEKSKSKSKSKSASFSVDIDELEVEEAEEESKKSIEKTPSRSKSKSASVESKEQEVVSSALIFQHPERSTPLMEIKQRQLFEDFVVKPLTTSTSRKDQLALLALIDSVYQHIYKTNGYDTANITIFPTSIKTATASKKPVTAKEQKIADETQRAATALSQYVATAAAKKKQEIKMEKPSFSHMTLYPVIEGKASKGANNEYEVRVSAGDYKTTKQYFDKTYGLSLDTFHQLLWAQYYRQKYMDAKSITPIHGFLRELTV